MATKLTKRIEREVDLPGEDVPVVVSVEAAGHGGPEVGIRRKGERASQMVRFRISDLASGPGKPSRPNKPGDWIRSDWLESQIGIIPGLTSRERGVMIAATRRIRLQQMWLDQEEMSWEEFLESRGESNLLGFDATPEKEDAEKDK